MQTVKRIIDVLKGATQYGVTWEIGLGQNGELDVTASTKERELNITVRRNNGKRILTSTVTRKKKPTTQQRKF